MYRVLSTPAFRRLLAAAVAPAVILAGLAVPASAASGSTATLTFSDSAISASGDTEGFEIDGTDLKITKAGTYTLTGSCADGSVTVKKEVTGVTLILDDLTLSASDTAPLTCNKSSQVTVKASGSSVLTDKESLADEESDDFEGAAIKVKSGASLTLTGDGSLTLDGSSCKNGIKGASDASVTVSGSSLTIKAAHDALSSDGSVTVSGGELDITAENDGIVSQPDEDDADSAGTVTISGGELDITAAGDGVQATGKLTVSGGELDITSGGGYQAALAEDDSAKGLKSDTAIDITGGAFTLDCADDAIHTDGDAVLAAGTYTLSSGDDGIHADGSLTLGVKGSQSGPTVTISQCEEGLEGTAITLYSGSGSIVSDDDGINAANSDTPDADFAISCYDGEWTITAGGDGLDSNGDVNLYGGVIEIYSYGNGDSALDYGGSCNYEGGTLLAVGMAGMAQSPSSGVSVTFGTVGGAGGGQMGGMPGGQAPDGGQAPNGDQAGDPPAKPEGETSSADGADSADTSGQRPTPPDQNGTGTDSEPPALPSQDGDGTDGQQPSRPDGKQPGGDDASALSISQGSTLKITDSSGETIYTATSLTQASSVVYAGENLSEGETYTLYIDGSEAATAQAQAGSGQQAGSRFPGDNSQNSDMDPNMGTKLPFLDISSGSWYYDSVAYVYQKGLMQGTGSGAFSPSASATRGMAVTLLYRLAGSPEVSDTSSFSDVEADAYYAKAVAWASQNGIVTGYDTGEFSPDSLITREQLAAILYRYAVYQGYDTSQTGNLSGFSDSSAVSGYAKTALSWANGTGLITGTGEQTLAPGGTTDRAQLATVLSRFCQTCAKA